MSGPASYTYILSVTGLGAGQWLPSVGFSGTPTDPIAIPAGVALPASYAIGVGYRGTVEDNYTRIRVPTVLYTGSFDDTDTIFQAAGDELLRVLGFTISVCGSLAVAGALTLSLDGPGGPLWTGKAYCSDSILGDTQMGADYGNGVDTELVESLTLTFSAALTGGSVGYTVWGCLEE